MWGRAFTSLYACALLHTCTGNPSEEIMASSNLKRKLEFDVSEIGEEINSGALVHGRVLEMSLIKNSRKNKDIKYVEGQLTDGKEVCRFISFDVKIRDDIDG